MFCWQGWTFLICVELIVSVQTHIVVRKHCWSEFCTIESLLKVEQKQQKAYESIPSNVKHWLWMTLDVVNTDCRLEVGVSPCVSFCLRHWLCSFRDAPRGLETSLDLAQQLIPETIRGGGGGWHGRQQFKVRKARRDNVLKCICSHQHLRCGPSFPYFHYLPLKGALCTAPLSAH